MHHRLSPKKHRFNYNVFMFYIDLDEVEMLSKKLWMFSKNKFNYFSLKDSEHLQLPIENPDKTKSIVVEPVFFRLQAMMHDVCFI